MSWHGYFYIKVSDSLNETKLNQAINGILELGNYPKLVDDEQQEYPNTNTAYITHYIQINRRFIFELILPSDITKAQIVTKLANKLGYTEEQIEANIDDYIKSNGINWNQRRINTRTYMINNSTIWFNNSK